eukprot:TRINITY_DN45784_c0_g2_i1.p1 TRINITY_DN45784_c0_g2~~TRINITY_DN45784_c0_g2_i1.p1  ORF type:complete len:191 (-),score=43.09 TRINITY_DN45784_c0_g2_i1:591-1163(-)
MGKSAEIAKAIAEFWFDGYVEQDGESLARFNDIGIKIWNTLVPMRVTFERIISETTVALQLADPLAKWSSGDTKTLIKYLVENGINEAWQNFFGIQGGQEGKEIERLNVEVGDVETVVGNKVGANIGVKLHVPKWDGKEDLLVFYSKFSLRLEDWKVEDKDSCRYGYWDLATEGSKANEIYWKLRTEGKT